VRDFLLQRPDAASTIAQIADNALSAPGIDAAGLDAMDRALSFDIAIELRRWPGGVGKHGGGACRSRATNRDIIEPYLIKCGYLQNAPSRGSLMHLACFPGISASPSRADPAQFEVVGNEARSEG